MPDLPSSVPDAPALSGAAREEILRLAGLYEQRGSALLPALFAAQREGGHLTPPALVAVAGLLRLPLAEVVAVATFYHLFSLEPTGRHVVRVCTSISCMLNGCGTVLRRLESHLEIATGQTTPGGRFSLRAAECLAACEEAPVLLVDEDRWARVTPDGVEGILNRYR